VAAILRTCAIAVLLGCAAPSAAEPPSTAPPAPALRRLDVAGLVGWLGEHRSETGAEYYDDWTNRWYGTGVAGWYWTSHLKTELEVGITNAGESWASFRVGERGPSGYPISVLERRFQRDVTVAVTQQWQFFENAWVHPFVAAGVSVDRTRIRRDRQHTYWGPGDEVLPGGPLLSEVDVRAHALFGTGLKAYMNERAFFRADFQLAVGAEGPDQVRLRTGFGVDF
jgi:hypothetical protein